MPPSIMFKEITDVYSENHIKNMNMRETRTIQSSKFVHGVDLKFSSLHTKHYTTTETNLPCEATKSFYVVQV
jgi:hypothetical protein